MTEKIIQNKIIPKTIKNSIRQTKKLQQNFLGVIFFYLLKMEQIILQLSANYYIQIVHVQYKNNKKYVEINEYFLGNPTSSSNTTKIFTKSF